MDKLFTLIRAYLFIFKQAVLVGNKLTVSEQELAHCEAVLQQLSREYSHISAEIFCLQRSNLALNRSICQIKEDFVEAIKLQQEDLADVISKSMAAKQQVVQQYSDMSSSLQKCQLQLRQLIATLTQKIQISRLDLRLVKTMNSSQQAAHLMIEGSTSDVNDLAEQLRASRQKQMKLFDQVTAQKLLERELNMSAAAHTLKCSKE